MSNINKRTWVEVDLDAIIHNFKLAQRLSGGKNVMPVVKANAYGHGAVSVAKTLEEAGAKIFAVATLNEAIQLRENGIKAGVLILGATLKDSFDKIVEYGFIQEVSDVDYAYALSETALKTGRKAKVHIKVDTGMGRLGFAVRRGDDLEKAKEDILKVCAMDGLIVDGMFAHFATADAPGSDFADEQLARFRKLSSMLENEGVHFNHRHVSNSGSIINYPNNEFDTVREGIILYGYLPDKSSIKYDFIPAMSVRSIVSHISHIRQGESIGYGRTFFAHRDMTVAVIPIGYADGYNRMLSNKGRIFVKGCLCPVVGRVCMDQLMIDVTGVNADVGDEVSVMCAGAPDADEIADMTGTISYEVLCGISRPDRVYLRNGKIIDI